MRLRRWYVLAIGALMAASLLVPACGSAEEESVAPAQTGGPLPSPTPISPLVMATATRRADFGRIIFLHHSVGANLIAQGDVRQRLTDLGYEFYDHGHNAPVLE